MKHKHNGTWRRRKLDELGFVGRGKSRHRPRNALELYDGPYPFVQTADIMASEFYITSYSKTYSEAGLAQSKLWEPNTLCMTIAGENTAETAILSFRACFPDSVVGFIADPEQADVRFVKYYLDHIRRQIRQVTRGATQDNLSLDKLLSFDIIAPPVQLQTKIASIAAAYDELILNSQRRIAVLEKMAQAFYRDWFVNFRFPGHEKVKLINSPLGRIPEGWAVRPFTDIADIFSGGTPKTTNESYWNGDIPFFTPKDCPDDFFVLITERSITTEGLANCASSLFPPRTVFITARGTVGKTVLTADSMAMSQSCYAVAGKEYPPSFILMTLRRYIEELKKKSHGAVFDTIIKDTFIQLKVLCPSTGVVTHYCKIMSPLFDQILALSKKQQVLRRTRDLLLPKLISGELDVEAVDIETGEPLVEVGA